MQCVQTKTKICVLAIAWFVSFFWDTHDNSWHGYDTHDIWTGVKNWHMTAFSILAIIYYIRIATKFVQINWQTQSLTLKLTLALGKSKTSTKTLVLLAIAQNGGGGIWILFNTAYSRDATGLYCSPKATREEWEAMDQSKRLSFFLPFLFWPTVTWCSNLIVTIFPMIQHYQQPKDFYFQMLAII